MSIARAHLARRIALIAGALVLVVGAEPAIAGQAPNPNALEPIVTYTACGGGISVATVRSSEGFDPLTATNAQLIANYLPPRPSGKAAVALWTRFVTSAKSGAGCGGIQAVPRKHLQGPHTQVPTTDLVRRSSVPPSYGSHSANWAGNVATGTYWNDADGLWDIQVPQAPGCCGWAYSSQWVGIGQGGSSSRPLVQAGTEDDAAYDRLYSHIYLWWEVVWAGGGLYQQDVSGASAGDTIWVHIHVPNNCGNPTMTIGDENTHFWQVYSYSHFSCSDGTAEWIFERTDISNTYPWLANAAVDFLAAQASGPGVDVTGVGNLPHYYVSMFNCRNASDTLLAYPGPISSDGNSFTNYWNAYGSATPVSSCGSSW